MWRGSRPEGAGAPPGCVGDEVYIARMGTAVVLIPKNAPWDLLFETIDGMTSDFMERRDQPEDQQERDLELSS